MDPALPLAEGESHVIAVILLAGSRIFLQLPRRHWTRRDGLREPGLTASPISTVSIEPEQLEKWNWAQSAECHETACFPKLPWASRQCSYLEESAKRWEWAKSVGAMAMSGILCKGMSMKWVLIS